MLLGIDFVALPKCNWVKRGVCAAGGGYSPVTKRRGTREPGVGGNIWQAVRRASCGWRQVAKLLYGN